MTKTSSLENLLQVHHGDLHTVIPPLVAESGARRAASELGVSQAWVYRWLKRNGYATPLRRSRVMASKSHAVIICEHLQARFDWWYSLYTSLLEVKAAYEKHQPFSSDPYGDAAILDALIDDADWAYQMSQSLASELCRAEEALAVKSQPKPKPQPQPAPEPEPEPIDVSDIPFALTDEKLPPVGALAIESAKAKPRKYRVWQPKYKWPLTPRVVRVPLLGEVE